jgi:hypothetical protein
MLLRSLILAVVFIVSVDSFALAEPCSPNDPTLIKPDITALTPLRARVQQRGGSRKLYFTTKIANVGRGPLIIEGKTVQTPFGPVTQATQQVRRSNGTHCQQSVGTFEFHVSHNHFHLNDFAEYQLRKGDPYTGEIVARASKISFCLTDNEPLKDSRFNGQRQVDANCSVQEGVQGISSGWADVYDDFYPEQYIELDICHPTGGVPAGQYWLVNVADPDNLLLEDNEDFVSNAGVVSVNIPARVANQPIPACPDGPAPQPTATQGGSAPTPTQPVVQPTPTRPVPTATAVGPTARPTRTPRIIVRPTRAPRSTRAPRPTRIPRPTRPPR